MNVIINNEIRNIQLLIHYFRKYGFELGGISLLDGLARRFHINELYTKTSIKRKKICQDYIRRNYIEIIEKYRNLHGEKTGNIKEDYIIWIFWWQGENNMPYPVNLCMASVRHHMQGHQIILVSKENYNEYIDVPDYILHKVEMGKISYAHFSDYVRVALLAKYGGMWIDSTFYMTDSFSIDICNYRFFSINHGGKRPWVASNDRWSICLLACNEGYKLMIFLKELMENYWKNEDCAIAYLISDYEIDIAYNEYRDINRDISLIPINNSYSFIFSDIGNDLCQKEKLNNILNNSNIFQLSYKRKWIDTIGGKKTFFGELVSRF